VDREGFQAEVVQTLLNEIEGLHYRLSRLEADQGRTAQQIEARVIDAAVSLMDELAVSGTVSQFLEHCPREANELYDAVRELRRLQAQ
jgi:hypothetical protein